MGNLTRKMNRLDITGLDPSIVIAFTDICKKRKILRAGLFEEMWSLYQANKEEKNDE